MPSQASGFSVRKNSIPALLCALAVISMLDSNVEGQPCASPSSGLVSWWQGEGNTMDAVGSNTGTPTGNLGFVTGRVGQAFSSDGNGDAVFLGNPANLQLQDLTIEAWIKRGSATIASLNAGGGLIVGYGGGGWICPALS